RWLWYMLQGMNRNIFERHGGRYWCQLGFRGRRQVEIGRRLQGIANVRRLFRQRFRRGLFQSCGRSESGHLLGTFGTLGGAGGCALLGTLFPTGSPPDELGGDFADSFNRRPEPYGYARHLKGRDQVQRKNPDGERHQDSSGEV